MKICPRCGALNIRKSHRRIRSDRRPWLFSCWFRCEHCGHRFLGTDWTRARRWVGGGCAAFAVLALGSWAVFGGRPTERRAEGARRAESGAVAEPTGTDAVRPGELDAPDPFDEGRPESRGVFYASRSVPSLRTIAEGGDAAAQLELGRRYETGIGTIEDFAEAVSWYRRAADQGEPAAMSRLGQMAAAGRGMNKDPFGAYVWLNLAAARGDIEAAPARQRVRALLTDAQLAEAQERCRELDRKIPPVPPSSRAIPPG